MTDPKTDRPLVLLLRASAVACFAGWTWAHLYWEAPYGVILWSEGAFALAERLGVGWEGFVGSGANDGIVQLLNRGLGWLYLLCGILSITARAKSRLQLALLAGGSGLLVLLSYAKYVSSGSQLPMFVEHGGQMLTPILLVLALARGARDRVTVAVALVAFITTFCGHGIYALGLIWPTPSNFYGMTSVILGVGSETARIILLVAGVLDFVICIGLFLPSLRRPSALYGAAWGFLTALARPVAGMSLALNYWGADQFLHEFLLRAPHFMIPLYLFFLWRPHREEAGALDHPVPEATAKQPSPN